MSIQKPLFDDTAIVETAMPSAGRIRSYDGDYMRLGRIAEEIVMSFLRKRPDVIGIDDLRELRVMHEADVDVSVRLTDGRVTLAEIKYDSHLGTTPNVLFEALRINHTCTPDRVVTLGWTARSPATWLLYYAPAKQSIYRVRFDDFRKRVQKFTAQARGTNGNGSSKWISWVNTDNIKSTLNFLIPWNVCKDIFSIHDVSEIATSRINSHAESASAEIDF